MKSFAPSLIIGLGGTGQWVLTHLKQTLLQTCNGIMPPGVRLLVFDTARKTSVRCDSYSGTVKLDEPGEYVYLGEQLANYVFEIGQGEIPHVTSWFLDKEHANKVLARSDFVWEQSIASFRQLGRLSLFQDLQSPVYSRIYNLLRDAIDRIRDSTNSEAIDIFVVGSLAGSSGSGMFIDSAYLARRLAETTLNSTVHGYFSLPEAFWLANIETLPGMRSRAYAALRELRRLSQVMQIGHPLYYHDKANDSIWHGALKKPLFDFLYLVDGRSTGNPVSNTPLEHGVAPMLSDAIYVKIDAESDLISQHKVNLAAVIKAREFSDEISPQTFVVGAVGVYTIVFPVHQLVEHWACRLGMELLDVWLRPMYDKQTQFPMRLLADRNAESPGKSGIDEAYEFLTRPRVFNPQMPEQIVELTQWPATAAQMVSILGDTQETIQVFSRWSLNEWCTAFEPPGQDEQSTDLRERLRREFQSRLIDLSGDSQSRNLRKRGGLTAYLTVLIQKVQEFTDENLGIANPTTGYRTGGRCREVLEQCAQLHLQRFTKALAIQTLTLLEGQSEIDPYKAKGGKLGYAYHFLEALAAILDKALHMLTTVKRGHTVSVKQHMDTLARARHWQQEMLRDARERERTLFDFQKDWQKSRDKYLEEEQRLVDIGRSEVMDHLLIETLGTMLRYVQALQGQVEQWMETLALACDSVYTALLHRQRYVNEELASLDKLKTRWILRDQAYEQERYQAYVKSSGRDAVADFLSSLVWDITGEGSSPIVKLGWRNEEKQGSEVVSWLPLSPLPVSTELFLNRCRRIFAAAPETESVIHSLMRVYPNPIDLADWTRKQSGVALGHHARTPLRANYLHVASTKLNYEETQYVQTWLQRLEQFSSQRIEPEGATQRFAYLVRSEESSRCNLMYTEELLPLETLDAANREVQNEYWHYRQELQFRDLDRRMLHILPGEVNAVGFEDRLHLLGQPKRFLRDEIVIQLERRERMRLFVLSYIYGLIRTDVRAAPGNAHTVWILSLPTAYRNVEEWLLTSTGRTGSIIEALTTFSFDGKDQDRPSENLHLIPYATLQQTLDRMELDDAQKRAASGTAGQRLADANWRNLIAALEKGWPEAYKRALLAAAKIDRLTEADDFLQIELTSRLTNVKRQEAQILIDLYSVFRLLLRECISDWEQDIQGEIVIIMSSSRTLPTQLYRM